MPSHYEYALMSNLVYSAEEKLKPSEQDMQEAKQQYAELKKTNWEHYPEDETYDSTRNLGYYATRFINHKTKEIVIAHRGTIYNPDHCVADIDIFLGKAPAICQNAIRYTRNIYTEYKVKREKYRNYTISQTGHSLGGFLAQVTAAELNQTSPVD